MQRSCENNGSRLQTRKNGMGAAGGSDIDGQLKVGPLATAAETPMTTLKGKSCTFL
jgi:hypothetical protein